MKCDSCLHILKSIIVAVFISVAFSSCVEEMGGKGNEKPITIRSISEAGNLRTKSEISSNADLEGETFGIYASYASHSLTYFNGTSAIVNEDFSATISSTKYWPDDEVSALKFFSWYPYSGNHKPNADLSVPGQMTLTYTADESAANHTDVLAAISEHAWGSGVDIDFYHTLTKVTFTFRKEDPAPDEVTIDKIEFQDVGVDGKLTITEIPAFTSPEKPSFSWTDITTGNITSTPVNDNTVTGTVQQIGDTFLMLPTEEFPATAKIVITSSLGVSEFNLRDIVADKSHSWKSGEYINYNIKISDMIYQITAQPLEWESNPVNVIFDKQYYLKVEKTLIEVAHNAVTVNIEAETNYKMSPESATGYGNGAFLANVDNPNSTLSSIDLGWANVSMAGTQAPGDIYRYNIQFVVQSYNAGATAERAKEFYIKAGNMRHRMVIKQYGGNEETWLTSTGPEPDAMDRFKITLSSGRWEWKVSGLSDPDDILLNKESILIATGVDGGEIYFYYKASAPSGKTATITVTNTNGNNAPVSIVLTAP